MADDARTDASGSDTDATGVETDTEGRALGINHVALPVGDVETALEWYREAFGMPVRGQGPGMAFLDMGDQFLALSEVDERGRDDHRHVGLVVDDVEAVLASLAELGAERLDTGGVDVRDPWGNRLQLVQYDEVQFTKAEHVLDGMDVDRERLRKTESALAELAAKGMAPE